MIAHLALFAARIFIGADQHKNQTRPSTYSRGVTATVYRSKEK